MRTETRTVRIGELLGPVDWSYDFAAHGWDKGGSTNPKSVASTTEWLRTLDEALKAGTLDRWEATTDGGWPRVGWGRVLEVGMYDGWPYWHPVPSVLIAGRIGGAEWTSWLGLAEIRLAQPPDRNSGHSPEEVVDD